MGRGLALLGVWLAAGHQARAAAAEPVVRVEVLAAAASVRVTVPGPCQVLELPSRRVLTTFPSLAWQEARPTPQGVRLGPWQSSAPQIQILPTDSPLIFLNGARYRGRLTLVRVDAARLQIVNAVPLEAYLRGVVPAEVDARWPMEALKAQAIIARTFTLLQITDRAAQPFDVTASWPQLYGGLAAERPRATQAVELTRGLILTAGGSLLPTYYHTVCGGRTEDVGQLWPKTQRAPLRGVECRHCRRAPQFHWTLAVDDGALRRALQRGGVSVGAVRQVAITSRNRSGRVVGLRVAGDEGTVTVPAPRWRAWLGANRLRSTNFVIRRRAGGWVFDGYGWGHGVGLCQWGAAALGQRKRTAEQILAFYYPGAEIGERW